MPRSRLLFTAPIVLAIVIIGVFAIRSRGDNSADVDTAPSKNCPPIARADAVATKPATPISIDVLANDTDPDGDPLVFQIRTTTGGDATIDDGGTPTDASDDRIMFTPADPAPPEATVDYQALDPDGAISESTVTITINAEGALPAGVQSEAVPDDSNVVSTKGCGTGRVSTSTTGTTVVSSTETTQPEISGDFTTPTTKKSSKTTGHTTTTKKSSTSTTKAPSSPGSTTATTPTTQHTTTTSGGPTTTGSPPTTKDCGPQPDPQQDPEGFSDWQHCTYGR